MSPEDAASILSWWSEAGVDTLVAETPRDWLRAAPAAEPAPPAAAVAEAPMAIAEAEEELPGQLDLFRAWLASTDRLAFAAPSAPRICPSGDPASGLMILADMPNGEDCAAGVLITGEAGRLFDRMLAAIGRSRDSVYLAALSCLRSPDGQLSGEPARRCADLARHQIGLVAPRALLLLGDSCARAMLGLGVAQARGRWHEVATHSGPIRTLVTMKPDFLLAQPAHKARAWADLQMLIEEVRS